MSESESDEDRAVRLTLDNWEALGIEEHAGILHLPATIKRRDKTGGTAGVPVMLRNLSNPQRFRARALSRELAARHKLDLDRDSDLVDQLENYAILAFAIRDPKTFDQHAPDAETLLARYDTQSLAELWGRYDVWISMLDPRFGEMDGEQLWRVIVRIAREKTPAPLVAMHGAAQFTCIVLMAEQALRSTIAPSWLQSPETSSAASSPPSKSEGSSA